MLDLIRGIQEQLYDLKVAADHETLHWTALELAYEATRLAWYCCRSDDVGISEKLGFTAGAFHAANRSIREALGTGRGDEDDH